MNLNLKGKKTIIIKKYPGIIFEFLNKISGIFGNTVDYLLFLS